MWSADKFTDHALRLGQHLRLSKFVIGFAILGFGTSAPELLVSGLSAWQGNPGLAIGNALGSNATNILLILGVTLCIMPLYINKDILCRDFPLLIAATTLLILLVLDQKLQRLDSIILILALGLILYLLTRIEMKKHEQEQHPQNSIRKSPTILLIGLSFSLAVLLLSSKLVVWSAVEIATHLDVKDLIIGLTIVALGTSLPELATCIASAMKKRSELILGNIIGSNIFNTLGVSGTAGIIAAEAYVVPRQVYIRDIPIMAIATLGLFLLAWLFLRKNKIPRSLGILFFTGYLIYIFFIYRQAL